MSFVTLSQLLIYLYCSEFVLTEKIIDGGNLKTCPRPIPPKNAVISYIRADRKYPDDSTDSTKYGVYEYHEFDAVHFQCKEGYSQLDYSAMYITCGSDGEWFPKIKNAGKCIANKDIGKCQDSFLCKTSGTCVSASKRCDCYPDCSDGSDEENCKVKERHITARTTRQDLIGARGREANGIITSPNYPVTYPRDYSCIYHISTFPNYRIEIDFLEFNIPQKVNEKCTDYVRVNGLHPYYFSYHLKDSTRLYSRKQIEKYETRCGKDYNGKVYSNFTHVAINISLGNLPKHINYHGVSLKWRIRSSSYVKDQILNISEKMQNKIKRTKKTKDDDNLFTVITPISISALLPISLIILLCFHRRLRQRCLSKRSWCSNKRNENGGRVFTLTVDNLAKFNDVNPDQKQAKKKKSKRKTKLSEEREHFIVYSKAANTVQTSGVQSVTRENIQIDPRNSIETQTNANKSNEIPRYIMSYDMQMRIDNKDRRVSTVIKRDNDHSRIDINEKPSRDNLKHLSKSSIEWRRSKSPVIDDSLQSRSRSSKGSHENGPSSNSKSRNSCNLCSHRKGILQKPTRMTPPGFESGKASDPQLSLGSYDELHNFSEYNETESPVNEYSELNPLNNGDTDIVFKQHCSSYAYHNSLEKMRNYSLESSRRRQASRSTSEAWSDQPDCILTSHSCSEINHNQNKRYNTPISVHGNNTTHKFQNHTETRHDSQLSPLYHNNENDIPPPCYGEDCHSSYYQRDDSYFFNRPRGDSIICTH